MNDSHILRETFNKTAQEYDAIRPGYPDALIEDVISFSGIPEGGVILEIGCGTGQATLPFAQRGYNMLCLDIGADMLAIARQKLAAYPRVRFQQAAFEHWPETDASSAALAAFDLLTAATAFHWVPREVGYPKAARVLKPGGTLARFSNEHPRPSGGFFEEVQAVYDRYKPSSTAGFSRPDRPLLETKIEQERVFLHDSGLFAEVVMRTYPWKQTYTTTEYLRLLNTYSDILVMEEGARRSMFQGIADLIERRYGGQVEKHYLAVLYLAKTPKEGSYA